MLKRKHMSILSAGLGMTLVACSQAGVAPDAEGQIEPTVTTAETKTVTLAPPITTVKPGASVTFSHTVAGPVLAGDNASVQVTVNEGYPAGTMTLEASSIPGLDVFGAGVTARKDMSVGTTHGWRIDFEAANDGVYYLPVLATVAPDGGLVSQRAYAVRIEVGDWKAVEAKVEAAKSLQALPTGEMAMIMQAEETIE